MELHEKFFIARKLLSLKQKEAAEQSGVSQTNLSILERGERVAIPIEYFKFLYKKGIDLNWFYNEEDDVSNIFRKEEDVLNKVANSRAGNVLMNQQLWVPEILSLKNVQNLDKVLTELLSEIKHLKGKIED